MFDFRDAGGIVVREHIPSIPMKPPESNIIADGPWRHRQAQKQRFSMVKRRIASEVRHRHEEELRQASFWQRLWLEAKMRREIATALKQEFPPGTLHLARVP
jgi:hypothetical protein